MTKKKRSTKDMWRFLSELEAENPEVIDLSEYSDADKRLAELSTQVPTRKALS